MNKVKNQKNCLVQIHLARKPKARNQLKAVEDQTRIPPPPSDLGHGATKNSEIWHVRRVSQYECADKIAILKIKAFLNYANLC